MIAVDAELDELGERLAVVAFGKDRQRVGGDGAVVAGPQNRVVQRVVLLHQLDRMCKVAVAALAILQGALPEGALFRRAAPEGQHDGQGDLALAEIVADILAECRHPAAIIQRIVDKLEGDAEIAAVGFERRGLGAVALRNDGADLGGGGKKRRRLRLDDAQVSVLGGAGVLGRGKLHHLALGDDRCGIGDDFEGAERSRLDHQLEGAAEQEISDENARLVAPQHPRGLRAAPHVAFVHHIVVKQGRRVQELDGCGELDVVGAVIAAHPRRRDGEHRPQALAARIDEMAGQLRHHRHFGCHPFADEFVDGLHVAGYQRLKLLDCILAAPALFLEGNNNAQYPLLKIRMQG